MGVLEEKITMFLQKNKTEMTFEDLKKEFKIKSEVETVQLKICLDNLELEGVLYLDKKNRYSILCNEKGIIQGPIHISKKGNGSITTKDGHCINITQENLEGVFDGDIVTVNNLGIYSDKNIYGLIDKVMKRGNEQIACIVSNEDGELIVSPHQSNSKNPIILSEKELKHVVPGEIILVDISSTKLSNYGKVISSLGHKDDPDVDTKAIVANNGFNIDFSPKTKEELKKIPREVEKKSYHEGRKDLRNQKIFTIDDKKTKDIDDAISIELLENGNYKLYVHIADVSYYVKENTSIFNDAFHNGTSVYVNGFVFPMFDHILSNGICSLNPCVDRLTKTCEMTISPTGQILEYDVYKSIIQSKKQMNYDDVNRILEQGEVVPGYEQYINDLNIMNKLSNILSKNNNNRGYIGFNVPEYKVTGSKENMIIELRPQNTAEKLIENFMLAANETIATYISWMDLPFIYRVHEKPSKEAVKKVVEFLNKIGCDLKNVKDLNSNYAIQNIANQISSLDEYAIFSELLLRGMKKAKYDSTNVGHFGLALDKYTHFTSPIRRFPDFIVHMLLDAYLENDLTEVNYNALEERIQRAAIHCSQREKAAVKSERETILMRMAEYMEDHIGEEYEAIITSIDNHGMFVRTTDHYLGKVGIHDMEDDYFFDERTASLISRKNHKRYQIGDTVKCKVINASKEERIIDFKTECLIKQNQRVLRRA